MLKIILVAVTCLSLSGCTIMVDWNKLRIGRLDDTTIRDENGNDVMVEKTTGLHLQWYPDN